MAPSAIWIAELGPDGSSHPVETRYDATQLYRSGLLQAPMMLPPELVLVDGKVACTTCHDGASPYPYRTTLPMEASALCVACHDY